MKEGSNIQPELNFTGEQLARAGLSLAVDHADKTEPGWSDRCWQLFKVWLSRKPRYFEFMIEDFRSYLNKYDLIENPPSLRAFGMISKRGLKSGFIEHAGICKVKNRKAHATPANLWRKK